MRYRPPKATPRQIVFVRPFLALIVAARQAACWRFRLIAGSETFLLASAVGR